MKGKLFSAVVLVVILTLALVVPAWPEGHSRSRIRSR